MPGGRNTQIELFLREYFDWDGVESALPFNLKADEERRVIVQFEEGRPSLSSKLISPLNIRICRHAVAPLRLTGLISSSGAVVDLKSSIVIISENGAPLKELLHKFPKFFAHYLDGDAAPSKALKDAAIRKTKGKK